MPARPAVRFLLTAAAAFFTPPAAARADDVTGTALFAEPGFETVPPGPLPTGPAADDRGWEVQRTGRPAILDRLTVAGVEDPARARSGRRAVKLGLPADTEGFEFVTVGRRRGLKAGAEYEAAVWVRWPGGPAAAPAGADAAGGRPSAIVSFWARHGDGEGDYAGRDVWLFDRNWTRLAFRFRAVEPAKRTLIYVSLLPNQSPRATELLADDFTLTAFPAPAVRSALAEEGDRVADGGFEAAPAGPLTGGAVGGANTGGGGWYFAPIGGPGVTGEVVSGDDGKFVRLAMGGGTSNFRSARLWQTLDLREGARYEVRCRIRRDGPDPDLMADAGDGPGGGPILNYGLYHRPTDTWYGPIDQVLRPSADWETYAFPHVPPHGGAWELYVQLNGWGNFGAPLTVSLDDFSVGPAAD